jgi:hypothetical protein
MKSIIFSHHALLQMESRGLSRETVIHVINNPSSSIIEEDQQVIYQQITTFKGREALVRVFVNERVTPSLIKTAYITSKIKKYLL